MSQTPYRIHAAGTSERQHCIVALLGGQDFSRSLRAAERELIASRTRSTVTGNPVEIPANPERRCYGGVS
jgi:hypothetical protein